MIRKLHRNLYEYVVEELGLRIIRGDYLPGDTLPNEDLLCREFEVSRGVLREATKVLVQKGLIRSRPRIGTRVQASELWNLFDPDLLTWKLRDGGKEHVFFKKVTEVRRMVESEGARLAAIRADEGEIATIQTVYEQLADLLADSDRYRYETYLPLDVKFHTAILDASHNELLAQIGLLMRQAVLAARRLDTWDLNIQRESLPYHLAILEAIRQHAPESAYQASQAMFDQVTSIWGST